MTVQELIDQLETIPDKDRIVILARDPEGNEFNPLEDIATSAFSDGSIYLEELTESLEELGYTDEDLGPGDEVPAVVLWP